MSEWREFKIGDVCEVYDGPHATPPKSETGPIYLGINSILPDGEIDYENSKRISYADFPKWTKRVTPQKDDVVFSYEANLKSYAIIPEGFEGCLGRRMAIMRPNQNAVVPRFLLYYMHSPRWRKVIAERTVLGATVNRIPIATYPEFPICLPSLQQQERIAGVLEAYDKLIDNNRKQIALLEEAAQRLYKEWFVDLRFPGYRSVQLVNGLPNGWKKTELGSLFSFRRGKTIKKSETEDGPIPVIAGGLTPAYYHSAANTVEPVVTISGSGANAGFTQIHLENVWASDCSYIDSTVTNYIFFAYLSAKVLGDGFKQMQRGSAQPHVYPKDVNALNIVLPDETTLSAFEEFASAIYSKIRLLRRSNTDASEARNRLLPKLMSGEIEV